MIHGPDSPDAPSSAEVRQAMRGRDDWYEADKYPRSA